MQIPCSCGKTERPREPLLYPGIEHLGTMCRIGGSLRTLGASSGGGNLEIPPLLALRSNLRPDQGEGHCLVGSLTGAVASKRVTEAYEGSLSLIGNQAVSALA